MVDQALHGGFDQRCRVAALRAACVRVRFMAQNHTNVMFLNQPLGARALKRGPTRSRVDKD
ncbi:MAG: hypothetical protein JOY64_29265 [Alphaproteobacteria bacterium]|nr:hypothetical protein [Alphaproteobacteria bacterium]MBV8411751.1 hypothetical protein [Alphaproteobacteria bacterium]